MILGLGVGAVAWGAEPTVTVTDAGTVRGTVFVAAPPERVRALLLDGPTRLAVVGGEGTTATFEPDGSCVLEHTYAPNAIKAVRYTVRSCPSDTGLRGTLVRSDDLARLTSAWEVAAGDGGSWVTYELDAAPSFPLPAFVARAGTKAGVTDALTALSRHFAP